VTEKWCKSKIRREWRNKVKKGAKKEMQKNENRRKKKIGQTSDQEVKDMKGDATETERIT